MTKTSITRNSAKCTACGEEVVSTTTHHMAFHYCKVEPTPGKKWEGEGRDMRLVPSGETTYRFAVDGGTAYLRRVGEPSFYEDTSLHSEEPPLISD